MPYVISDLHLDHGNIIDYTNRPFQSVDEMNNHLITNWNSTISPDDVVLFLGDIAMADADRQKELLDQLNGNILFIKGNHDKLFTDEAGVPVVENTFIQHDRFKFNLVHDPEEKTDSWNGWVIHGHTHNNEMTEYPFIHPQNKTVNVSVELLNYKPVRLEKIINLISTNKRMNKL